MDSTANPYQAPENEEAPLFSGKFYLTGKNCKPGLVATRRHVILTKRFLHVGERTVPLEEIQEIGFSQNRFRPYFQGLRILLHPSPEQEENAIILVEKSALGAVQLKKLGKLKALIDAERGVHQPTPENVSWLAVPKLIWQKQLAPAFNRSFPLPFRILSFAFFILELILPVWLVVAGFRFWWPAGVAAIALGFMLLLPLTFVLVSLVSGPAYVLVAKIFKLPLQIQNTEDQ